MSPRCSRTGGSRSTAGPALSENWFERTSVAAPVGAGPQLAAVAGAPVVDVRYLEIVALPGGGRRLYYEARLDDETHELRTELVG